MEARPTRIGALSKREYDHDPKTMHWQGAGRTATSDAGSCISPNSPTRRSPRRSACTAPSFPAICNRPATYAAAGIPPILRWRALLRWLSGHGDRHPTRCMRLRPGTLHPGASTLSGQPLRPEEAAASWNERKIYCPLVDGYGPQLKL
jgi:hypothetical protein